MVVFEKLSFAVAGAVLGYTIGSILYNLVIFKLDGSGTPIWFYVTIVILAIAFAIISFWLHDFVLILATAIGGAYLSVRLLATMIGNYPDESIIAQEIAAGKFEGMPWYVYVYLAFMVILGISGVVTQCILKKKYPAKTKNVEHSNNHYESMI